MVLPLLVNITLLIPAPISLRRLLIDVGADPDALLACYNVDPVHFGVVMTANLGVGLVAPPVGVCLFVACGISTGPSSAVVRPLLPLLAVMIATVILITYWPELISSCRKCCSAINRAANRLAIP